MKKIINRSPQLITSLEVRLWNQTVGYLAITDLGISFEYELDFKKNGQEISPLEMPLKSTTIYTSPYTGPTFKGLPGVIADCLPDIFGQKVIDNYFFQHYALTSSQVNPLMSLAYLYDRSIGALEFLPQVDKKIEHSEVLSLTKLVDAAKKTISGKADIVAAEIMRVGASAGGMKAKAIIEYNPKTNEIRSGFSDMKKGFIPCIIKFDGVSDGDFAGYDGKLEYVYNLIAADCGIDIPRCFLIESPSEDDLPACHFITERFDRDEEKNKPFHVSSYCGMTSSDFRTKNSSNYENFLRTIRGICEDASQVEQGLRRCIFNLIMRNEDDHTKNFSFLMDHLGIWSLSPAYDLTYVRIPGGSGHQMSVNGKNTNFTKEDIIALGKHVDIKTPKILQIIKEVETSAQNFLAYADEVSLPEDFAEGVQRNFKFFL